MPKHNTSKPQGMKSGTAVVRPPGQGKSKTARRRRNQKGGGSGGMMSQSSNRGLQNVTGIPSNTQTSYRFCVPETTPVIVRMRERLVPADDLLSSDGVLDLGIVLMRPGAVIAQTEPTVSKTLAGGLGRWIGGVSNYFQEFEHVSDPVVTYVPSCPSSSPGRVDITPLRDAGDVANIFGQGLTASSKFTDVTWENFALSTAGTASGPVWAPSSVKVPVERKRFPLTNELEANLSATDLVSDMSSLRATLRDTCPAAVCLAGIKLGKGVTTLSLGTVFVDYHLRLYGNGHSAPATVDSPPPEAPAPPSLLWHLQCAPIHERGLAIAEVFQPVRTTVVSVSATGTIDRIMGSRASPLGRGIARDSDGTVGFPISAGRLGSDHGFLIAVAPTGSPPPTLLGGDVMVPIGDCEDDAPSWDLPMTRRTYMLSCRSDGEIVVPLGTYLTFIH